MSLDENVKFFRFLDLEKIEVIFYLILLVTVAVILLVTVAVILLVTVAVILLVTVAVSLHFVMSLHFI